MEVQNLVTSHVVFVTRVTIQTWDVQGDREERGLKLVKCSIPKCEKTSTRFLYGSKMCEEHYTMYVGRKKQED